MTNPQNDRLLRFELECRLRFINHAKKHPDADSPMDLFIDGFYDGIRALSHLRSVERLTELLNAAGSNPSISFEEFRR